MIADAKHQFELQSSIAACCYSAFKVAKLKKNPFKGCKTCKKPHITKIIDITEKKQP